MNNKPDDRRDNAKKIKKNIGNTQHNMELADEMITNTSDEKAKKDLKEKNKRREESIKGMREELKDEMNYQANKKDE